MRVRVVATAGHVDHGKSTLVRALTGTDPDRLAEEKQRGLTVDLGFARLATSNGPDVDIIDVPGHVRFLRNMLAGVGAIDACLFVVACTEGWKPQSEEHLRILELLDVRQGVVALTMAGIVGSDDVELTRMEVEEHTAGTFLEGADVVAVDSVHRAGLGELRSALERAVIAVVPRPDRGRPRLWVDRSFAVAGAGTVVTGTLTDGGLTAGEEVALLTISGARPARIRGLEAFGTAQPALHPGCRAAVNVSGPGHRELRRGDVLLRVGDWHLTEEVDVSLDVLPSFGRPVRSGGANLAYLGSGELPVRLRVLGTTTLAPGDHGAVRLLLPRALPLVPGDRYVLRDTGSARTVGGGTVLDVDPVLPPRLARPDRTVERVVRERGWVEAARLERLTGVHRHPDVGIWVVDPDQRRASAEALARLVQEAGPAGLDVARLTARQRALADADPALEVAAGRVGTAGTEDPLASHPFLAILEQSLWSPPSPESQGVDAGVSRELERRGLTVAADSVVFAVAAVDRAAEVAEELLRADPRGFTVADLRDALGTTRRYALALLALLDRDGITRRRGDRRVAGARLGRRATPSQAAGSPGACGCTE